ncbi:uncharacterized protein LOC124121293 isoform X2 [Haliotis rufescens]|nr:uncharacterized protein LOC124121293 isoform X2 [Haliotis rufescens]XP_048244813.1 uncharacterized protein LOC124121293 isoform X2 [Haliotis rufescens]XP_048244814.1 uncharacterized protein LOC124121293 isoform X2 [Haliotis rufescens]
MAESPSSRPTKVIDFQNCEEIQVGDNNITNKIFNNCIININNYYNQPPPPTADADHTTEPYLRQVQVQVKKKAKNNGRSATAPGRPRDQGPASHAVTITTQTVVDSEGSVLEPGGGVEIGSKANYNYGIFVGDGMVVTVDKNTRKVVKVPLDVKEPFKEYWAMYLFFSFPNYDRVQKVQRATGRVGQVFDGDDEDFVWWCYTGRKSFWSNVVSVLQN